MTRTAYRLSFSQLHAHLIDVEARFRDVDGAFDVVMAVWTPGSYLVRDYCRHVQEVQVEGGSARKLDKTTWRVEPPAGAREVVVRYRVYGWELSVRTNHVDGTHAFLNGAPTFLWRKDRAGEASSVTPIAVTIDAPAGWSVTTALAPGAAPGEHVAAGVDELLDSPILASPGPVERVEAAGRPLTLARWGRLDAGNAATWDGFVADTKKIVEAYAALMGGVPYDRYAFLLLCAPGGYGGLEHKSSAALVASSFAFATRKSYEELLELVSHEYFHLWNVKRIRPAQLGPFDYTRENHTRALWVAEGLTSYYDRWMVRRARLMTTKRYLERLAEEWGKYVATPGRFQQSLEESSFDAWIKLYRPDENTANSTVSYYLKGGLVCLCLDLEIRQRTGQRTGQRTAGQRTLDDVLTHMWREYGERPFDDTAVQKDFERAVGLDLGEFFDRHVRGREDPDLAGALRAAGYELRAKAAQNGDDTPSWLGIATRSEGGRLWVTQSYAGGPAEAAGLYAGDELLALDGFRVDEKGLADRVTARKPGDVVRATVFRRDELCEVPVTLAPKPKDAFEIVPVKEATDAEKALARAWLGED